MGKHQTQIGLESIKDENWKGKTVLDIGCGSGKLSLQIYHITHPSQYLGTDIDPNKIHMAQSLFRENNIANANFYLNDAAKLQSISNNFIDIIFCNIAFQQFQDKLGSLKEMFRVLKPGGKAIINAIEVKSEVRKKMESIAKIVPKGDMKVTKSEFDTLASKAGFSRFSSFSFAHTTYYPTVDELLGGYQKFEVIFPQLASLPKKELDNKWEQLKQSLILNKDSKGFSETWKILGAHLYK